MIETPINVIFFGTPHFAVPGLAALLRMPGVNVLGVVTQPDRPAGRGGAIQSSPVKQLAESRGIPVLQPRSIKRELDAVTTALHELGRCDIGVVIAFGQILPLGVLKLPRAGCVNVHASLLPRWRGAAPIHRALLAGDTQTGVCLMEMDEGLDTGGVYAVEATKISNDDTTGSLHDRLAEMGATLIERHIVEIAHSELVATPQPNEGITYAVKITSEEALIDWHLSAESIDKTVRAFNPFPGAFTVWQGKRVKIFSGCPHRNEITRNNAPGTVLHALGDRLEITTGAGTYQITALQVEGKRKMSVAEFVNGNTLPTGAVLG